MLSELCKLHSLGRQHSTLDTVRESGLKWENWKNTHIFSLQDPSRKENAFLTYLREKLHCGPKIWRIREVWTSRRFLGASCVWQHLSTFLAFHVPDSWEDSARVVEGVLYWGLSHGFIMVRSVGVALVNKTLEVIDLLVTSYQGCAITWLTVTDVDLDHLAEVSQALLSTYPTPCSHYWTFTHRNSASLSWLYQGWPLHPCSTTGCKPA